jgi:hypothetical protein
MQPRPHPRPLASFAPFAALALSLGVASLILSFSTIAFAQGILPAAQGSGPPTLTPTVGVVTTLSLVAGVLTNWIQTGTFLGRWISPKAWLPDLTMISTALGGFLGYITSQTPVSLSGSSLFYGAAAAVAALVSGATPSFALHAHGTLTRMRYERLQAQAAQKQRQAPTVPPVLPVPGAGA